VGERPPEGAAISFQREAVHVFPSMESTASAATTTRKSRFVASKRAQHARRGVDPARITVSRRAGAAARTRGRSARTRCSASCRARRRRARRAARDDLGPRAAREVGAGGSLCAPSSDRRARPSRTVGGDLRSIAVLGHHVHDRHAAPSQIGEERCARLITGRSARRRSRQTRHGRVEVTAVHVDGDDGRARGSRWIMAGRRRCAGS